MARDYELGIVLRPDASDDLVRSVVERLTQVVATNQGEVVRVNAWGRRRLAYPIEHHRDGLYFWFDLIMPPEAVEELERTIRVNEDIIRHLVTVREPRVAAQQRQREAEADVRAAEVRAAQAAAESERAERERTAQPVAQPTAQPTAQPVAQPTAQPVAQPTAAQSAAGGAHGQETETPAPVSAPESTRESEPEAITATSEAETEA